MQTTGAVFSVALNVAADRATVDKTVLHPNPCSMRRASVPNRLHLRGTCFLCGILGLFLGPAAVARADGGHDGTQRHRDRSSRERRLFAARPPGPLPLVPSPPRGTSRSGTAGLPWWTRMGLSSSTTTAGSSRGRGFRIDPALKLGSKALRVRNPCLGAGVLLGLVPSLRPDSPFGFRVETAFSRLYLPAGEARLEHEGWAWSLGTGFGLDLADPVHLDLRAVRSVHLSVDSVVPVDDSAWTFTTAFSVDL